jgi:phage terminase Nu1 subunit (DNA packaging protein)
VGAAVAQVIAAIILILVTRRYVKLTKEMADQTKRAIENLSEKRLSRLSRLYLWL